MACIYQITCIIGKYSTSISTLVLSDCKFSVLLKTFLPGKERYDRIHLD